MQQLEKTNFVTNAQIELGEDTGKGKGRYFQSRFIEAGLAHYEELGDILITKETLNSFIDTMVGCPVIIDHKDITDENVDKERVGVISKVWYNDIDGWFYCEGIITDSKAIDLIKNQGWSVSCAYSFVSDNLKKTYHGKEIDMEFTDGEFLHLAIVDNPRYEGANIVVNNNSFKEEKHPRNDLGQFIEKINKKGFEAKEEDFKPGDESKKYENGTPDRRPYIEEDKAHIFPEHDFTSVAHEYGHLFANRNPEIFKQFKETIGDWDEFIEKNGYEYGKDKNIMSGHDELFAQAFAHYTDDIEDEYTEIIKKLTNKNKNNVKNGKDLFMKVLKDLENFIKGVVENSGEKEEVKNEDKRELIDEIGGMLKDKVDEELWRTIIGKIEKVAYKPSEDDKADNKCKNSEDEEEKEEKEEKFEEEKEIAINEEKEDKEEDKKEDKEEEKEVKNSMDKIKEAAMGGNKQVKKSSSYVSQKDRLELGNKF